MFKNLFIYYFKENIRVKEIMFWNLAFPIVLSTLIFLALSNIQNVEEFKTINVGVESSGYSELLSSLETNNGQKLFNVVETDDYTTDIKNDNISGYLKGESTLEVVLGEKIVPNTILYSTAKTINQKYFLVESILEVDDSQEIMESLIVDLEKDSNHVKVGKDTSNKNLISSFFFTIIAMVCLGASSSGIAAVNMIQLDGGIAAAPRFNILPVSKIKVVLTMLMAALLVSILQTSIVLIYMRFVLGVTFGNMYLLLILAIIFSTLFGLLIGAVIGLLVKAKMDSQIALAVGVYLTSSFFAGMMTSQIRYLIASKLPLLAKINPATIIYQLFNAMYYFESADLFIKYFISLLIGIAILIVIAAVLARRREYERI